MEEVEPLWKSGQFGRAGTSRTRKGQLRREEGHEFASRGSLQSVIDLKPEAVDVVRTKVL
jgi:hypothetical protein